MVNLIDDEKLEAFTRALEEMLDALLGQPAKVSPPEKRQSRGNNKRRAASKKPVKRASKPGHNRTQKKRAAR